MVKYCVAYGCKQLQISGSGIQFHRFPFSRPAVLRKWVHALRRGKWTPTGSSTLCSKHFTEDCYQLRPGVKVKLLKESAVPSIFSLPRHHQEECTPRRQLPQFQTSVSQTTMAKEEDAIEVKEEPLVVHSTNFEEKDQHSSSVRVEPQDTNSNQDSFQFVKEEVEQTGEEEREEESLEPFEFAPVVNIKSEETVSKDMECDPLAVDEHFFVSEGHVKNEPQIKVTEVKQEGANNVKEEPSDIDDYNCGENLHSNTINVEPLVTDSKPVASKFEKLETEETNKEDVGGENWESFPHINVNNIKTEVDDSEYLEYDPLAIDEDCLVPKAHIKNEHQIKEESITCNSGGQSVFCSSTSQRSHKETNPENILTETVDHILGYNSKTEKVDDETASGHADKTDSYTELPGHSWQKEDMLQAVLSVRRRELTYKAASRFFHVPSVTVKSYIKDANDYEKLLFKSILRMPSLLPDELEKMLISYCYELKHGQIRKANSIFDKMREKLKMQPEIVQNNRLTGEHKKLKTNSRNCHADDLSIDCFLKDGFLLTRKKF